MLSIIFQSNPYLIDVKFFQKATYTVTIIINGLQVDVLTEAYR